MLSPDSRAYRARRQAETPLSVLFKFAEPALGSLLIDDSGAAKLLLDTVIGGTAKSYEFAAGALTRVGRDASGNEVLSLSSGASFVIADNGSASLVGGTSGGAGSILISSSETIGSGNLTFNYGTNDYGNGTITNSGGLFGNGYGFNNILDLDYQITSGYGAGSILNPVYNAYNDAMSSLLVNAGNTINYSGLGLGGLYDPIGAFYESTSLANDPAPSIAASTPRLLNTLGQGVTESGLFALDTNHDGKLTGAELASLRAWVDGNENGVAETGEIKTLTDAGLTEIREINYIYYAAGNAVAAPATVAAPAKPGEAVTITRTNLAPSVPFSNYRTLRDTDNLYPVPGGFITWTASQIKINYNSNSYLIGTDGTDAFDISYYAALRPIAPGSRSRQQRLSLAQHSGRRRDQDRPAPRHRVSAVAAAMLSA